MKLLKKVPENNIPPSTFANVWKIVYYLNFNVLIIFIAWTKNFQRKSLKTKTEIIENFKTYCDDFEHQIK